MYDQRVWFVSAALRGDMSLALVCRIYGVSRLAIGWVKLGIRLELTDSGSPQQYGRHARMHRALKKETSAPPATGCAAGAVRNVPAELQRGASA